MFVDTSYCNNIINRKLCVVDKLKIILFIFLVYCKCPINVCSESSFSFKGTAMCTYMRKMSNLVRKVMLLRSNCAVKLKVFDFSAESNNEPDNNGE